MATFGWRAAGLVQVTLFSLIGAVIMLRVRTSLFNNAASAAAH